MLKLFSEQFIFNLNNSYFYKNVEPLFKCKDQLNRKLWSQIYKTEVECD